MTLRWVPGWNGLTEPEAVSYVAAVEAADGQELEFGVAKAINDFVLGCKNDGIWDAIKASCILAGARTLSGALVPLVGTAPIKQGTEAGWNYNRETGLKGNGTDNQLNSNRANDAEPNISKHIAVFSTQHHTRNTTRADIGCGGSISTGSQLLATTNQRFYRVNWTQPAAFVLDTSAIAGLWGASRNNAINTSGRYAGSNYVVADPVAPTPSSGDIKVFSRDGNFSDARIAFYSIGESLDLALLDARVTTLMSDLAAAIP